MILPLIVSPGLPLSLSLNTVIWPSAIVGMMLISSESETVESVALTTDTVMSSPDSGAPVATSIHGEVIVPDSPESKG